MAATTGPRDTKQKGISALQDLLSLPVAAGTKINQGSLVVSDAGYAAPGRVATGLRAAGRAETSADNSSGAAGDKTVEVRRGTFKFANSAAADLIGQADVLADCFIVDDQTVAKTDGSGARSKAGKVIAVESDGVWVEII